MLKRSGLSDDDLLRFYNSVMSSLLQYASVAWHQHLTAAQTDEVEALQKRALKIILYSVTLPYASAPAYCHRDSLKQRRTEANKHFYRNIRLPDNCLIRNLPFS